jgi:hypothetical protein
LRGGTVFDKITQYKSGKKGQTSFATLCDRMGSRRHDGSLVKLGRREAALLQQVGADHKAQLDDREPFPI